ncbi:MAG: J domain-containing protein [Acidimicrobiales bacterium]
MPSHYEVLGVSSRATPEEIRRAYRRQARRLHPDHTFGGAPAAVARSSRAMQEVNEAWRVLGDPTSRAAYDARLVAGSTPVPAGGNGRDQAPPLGDDLGLDDDDRPYVHARARPGDVGISIVRALPWVVVLVVLGAIFVFTAFAGGDRQGNRADVSQLVGRCVSVQPAVGVVQVPCGEPNLGRVEMVTSTPAQCPSGSTATPAEGEERWLCLGPGGGSP